MFYTQLILRGKGESVKEKMTEGGSKSREYPAHICFPPNKQTGGHQVASSLLFLPKFGRLFFVYHSACLPATDPVCIFL